MDIKEFREIGLLQEINRLVLHPIGLALEVEIFEDGTERLGGIWDYREDPEGIIFDDAFLVGERLEEFKRKIDNVEKMTTEKHQKRQEVLGYVYQEPPK